MFYNLETVTRSILCHRLITGHDKQNAMCDLFILPNLKFVLLYLHGAIKENLLGLPLWSSWLTSLPIIPEIIFNPWFHFLGILGMGDLISCKVRSVFYYFQIRFLFQYGHFLLCSMFFFFSRSVFSQRRDWSPLFH